MTMLNGDMPIIAVEDSFRVTYRGTYGVLVPHPPGTPPGNEVDTVEGPIPRGKYIWDGKDYLGGMEAGEKRFVPFDVIRLWFGDPRSIMSGPQKFEDAKKNIGDIPPRPQETRRLSVLYGVYDTDCAKVRLVVPDVEIVNANDEEIHCPATDPDGLMVYGHVADSKETYDLATTIEQLKMQVRMLEEGQKANERKGHDNSGADVEVDGPKKRAATG